MAWNLPSADTKAGSLKSRCARSAPLLILAALLASSLGGCSSIPPMGTLAKDVGDYLNLRNSFLNPAEVGRFDKGHPFGEVRPVRWPILEQLDVVDETNTEWQNATDPTPDDLAVENKEYIVGAGDQLRVTVFGLVNSEQDYVKDTIVNDIGQISLQNMGAIQVSGLTPSQIEQKVGQVAISQGILLPRGAHNFGPQVSVQLGQSRARVFSILGVQRAGTYNIIGTDFRVLDALAIAGDLQPQLGLEYLYVIRSNAPKYAGVDANAQPGTPDNNYTGPVAPTVPTAPTTSNPLDTIDTIEKPTTTTSAPAPVMPAPPTEPSPSSFTPAGPAAPTSFTPASPDAPLLPPATGPGAMAPKLLGPLPMAVSFSNDSAPAGPIAQNDLDAAISGTNPSPTPVLTPAPATDATLAPAQTTPATVPTTSSGDELLNQAMGSPATNKSGQYIFVDGKWVAVGASTETATTTPGTPPSFLPPTTVAETPATSATTSEGTHFPANEKALADAEKMSGQRVIRIPITALRQGNPRYNIVVRPGDNIIVPTVEQGFFYMAGHVTHPGVYALSGQKITLKMAVAAAGNLDALAIPRRCELVRRIGPNEEAIVQVNLQAIFDAEQPDIFLKPNDVVNIGTDMVAPFLAVTRNAYRLSYGWGFVYDKNFAESTNQQNTGSGGL